MRNKSQHAKKKTTGKKGFGRRARRTREKGERTPAKSALFALLLSLSFAALSLLLFSRLLLFTKSPTRYPAATGMALFYLTAALAGFLATRLHGRRAPLLCGAFAGVFLFLLTLTVALLLPHTAGGGLGAKGLLFRSLLFPATLAGAFWGARQKKVRRRH